MCLHILSFLVWSPIITGCLFIFVFRNNFILIKLLSFCITFLCFCLSLYLCISYTNLCTYKWHFSETYPIVEILGIYYSLGVDGLSLPLLVLNCFVMCLVIIFSIDSVKKNIPYYYASFLIMQGFVNGVFCSADVIFFYIFFEAMLIPMFLIIGVWGGYNRIYATIKFFLYTFFSSIFLLLGIIYLHFIVLEQCIITASSFSFITYTRMSLDLFQQKALFLLFMIAFAIKIPMWPVHTWLPDAHVEAPTGGSVILAAITLKVGGYGILRLVLPILPNACAEYGKVMIFLSLIAIVSIGFITIVQSNLKKLIAYSSIAHMGFVTFGLFLTPFLVLTVQYDNVVVCIKAAIIQMISHGFISSALFFSVGTLYERMFTKEIVLFGGVAKKMPLFSVFFMIFALANIGLPGTSGFIGEFLIILESFLVNVWYSLFSGISIILSACYTLWMYKSIMFGTIKNKAVLLITDLTFYEKSVYILLVIPIIGIGIWPNYLLTMMDACVVNITVFMVEALVGCDGYGAYCEILFKSLLLV